LYSTIAPCIMTCFGGVAMALDQVRWHKLR